MGYNPTNKIGALVFTNREDLELEEILDEAYRLGQEL
ncbi:MAG: hypothetical protein ACJAYJ_000643 [Saprospiraceae bacterium]|jgi:hypothetical protein